MKRGRYFQDHPPGTRLFVIDADEALEGAAGLRTLAPGADVGWVTVHSSAYRRPYSQPRLFRALPGLRYAGRHHWVYAGERLLATHQHGGPGFLHQLLEGVALQHSRNLGRLGPRRSASAAHRKAQHTAEAGRVAAAAGPRDRTKPPIGNRESLRILQLSSYDPGLVAYRFHTALNTSTPHASVLGHRASGNPFAGPLQYDTAADAGRLRAAALTADVAHLHLGWAQWLELAPRRPRPPLFVVHHHGTIYRRDPAKAHAEDRRRGAHLRLVANPELLKYGDDQDDLRWLPNPVPVGWYRRLAAAQRPLAGGPLRVAHSPSKRHLKGTEEFLAAVAALRARGLGIEAVVTEGLHADVLAAKATCHASFDSFWLGMQCSGLEAAAMGQPVIAGDPDAAAYYRATVGFLPYTYANDRPALEAALEQLATDPAFFAAEQARVGTFVEAWHDEPAVASRYLDLLDAATGWRAQRRDA